MRIKRMFKGFEVEVRDDVFGCLNEVVVLVTEGEGRGFGVCGFCKREKREIVREIVRLIFPSLPSPSPGKEVLQNGY